jgi:hypothetical protein
MSYKAVTVRAIRRTGRKYRNSLADGVEMTQNDCERYVTSVIVKERGARDFDYSRQAREAGAR